MKGSTIPAHNADLKKARTSLIGGLAFTAIGAGATYYLFRLTSKWDRPLFDDREKVRFDGMAWIPGAQGGILMAGLTIELHDHETRSPSISFAVLCTTACKKDEIDLSSLTSNPFDAEYNGDPIFAMVDQETVEQTISGVVQQRLNVTVSVRSDLFPIATSYQVRAVRGSTTQVFFLNAQTTTGSW